VGDHGGARHGETEEVLRRRAGGASGPQPSVDLTLEVGGYLEATGAEREMDPGQPEVVLVAPELDGVGGGGVALGQELVQPLGNERFRVGHGRSVRRS